jgi:predicted amino acid dehydrogenase
MPSPKKFVFIVHALNNTHRSIIGLRSAKLGLATGLRDGTGSLDVSTLCRFHLDEQVFGEVVSIPMLPETLLENQDIALDRMHHAVKWAERDGIKVNAVGLGSLCSVVAGRGKALQQRLDVPVTTGNAATTWTLFKNCMNLNSNKEEMAIIGSGSPVGKMLCNLLSNEGIPLHVDSRKAIKNAKAVVYKNTKIMVENKKWIVGCGPTGPSLSIDDITVGSTIIDVALPHTVTGKRDDVRVVQGERMTMPNGWRRGFWGPLYHVISGYGWNTILACLVEPLVLASEQRKVPYAQGRGLSEDDVRAFGDASEKLGFIPVV